MRITKTTNPLAAIEFLPLYVELPDYNRKQLAENLFTQMSEKPNETLVLALINDINSIVGMVVAYVRPEENDVRIWQASSIPSVEKKWSDVLVGVVMGWAKSLRLTTITAESDRGTRLFKRRWGCVEVNDSEMAMEIK
jgi:hypothetical protein